jgi:3-carboxy-cis,cis-muconate cycloisomerase
VSKKGGALSNIHGDQSALAKRDLLRWVAGDVRMAEIWGLEAMVDAWLQFESALAQAQSELDIIPSQACDAIVQACETVTLDLELLQRRTQLVGYPILPLIEQLSLVSEDVAHFVHWGATTQDVMDTGLVLQIRAAHDYLLEQVDALGTQFANLAVQHQFTILSARTHAQVAVPTTFGAKVAVFLAEFTRHRDRIRQLRERVTQVQMFGAGGTSAAYGPQSSELRARVAEILDLQDCNVPWHSARDNLAECLWVCGVLVATCSRFAREVIALSRSEIEEVSERRSHLRGASSTMPQKANPITCEAIVGLAVTVTSRVTEGFSFMQAGHERAAGEWQAEWFTIPNVFELTAAAMASTIELVSGLYVDEDRMAMNIADTRQLIMAEAAMIQLSPTLGRIQAHDVIYGLSRQVGNTYVDLNSALQAWMETQADSLEVDLDPRSYLGESARAVDCSVAEWEGTRE